MLEPQQEMLQLRQEMLQLRQEMLHLENRVLKPRHFWQSGIFWSTLLAVLSAMAAVFSLFVPPYISYVLSKAPSPNAKLQEATIGTALFDSSKSAPSKTLTTQANAWDFSWIVQSTNLGSCQFTQEGYDVTVTQPDTVKVCRSNSIVLPSFAMTTQMIIHKGDTGGIIFRFGLASGNYHDFYYFFIRTNGTFGMYKSTLNQCPGANCISALFSSVPNSAIKQGSGTPNNISILANDNSFYLYANGKFLANVTDKDNPYSVGYIGFGAGFTSTDPGSVGEAVFSNVKIWDYANNG